MRCHFALLVFVVLMTMACSLRASHAEERIDILMRHHYDKPGAYWDQPRTVLSDGFTRLHRLCNDLGSETVVAALFNSADHGNEARLYWSLELILQVNSAGLIDAAKREATVNGVLERAHRLPTKPLDLLVKSLQINTQLTKNQSDVVNAMRRARVYHNVRRD